MASSFRTIAVTLLGVALAAASGDARQSQKPSQPQTAAGQPKPDAQQPAQPSQPVFRAGINFVRVDVIVDDKKGQNVGDLTQSDFEVLEDGKPQHIETFKLVKLDGGAVPSPDGPPRAIRTDFDEESEAAKDDVRLFGIFLDDYHVRRGTSMAARAPLARFVENQLGPSDMVAMMYPLESLSSLRFTRNHDAIAKGLQQFIGRKFEYEPKNQFEEQYAEYPAQTVELIRNQVSLSALKGLIIHMGSLKEGRKALILVSEGFTNLLPPQLRSPVATMPGLGNPAAGDPMAGVGDPLEDRARFFSSMDLETDLREVYDAANKNNVAIYAVDPRGLAGFEYDINENVSIQTDQQYLNSTMDTLRELSDQTDGRAIVNRNDLDTGMKQIIRDSSAYYLLGYNSTQAPDDGKFHQIKVRLKRPGLQVRARRGYWALTAEDTERALAAPRPERPKAFEAALATVSTPARDRVIRTWIGTSRGENGKTKVTFVWEPIPRAPGDRREDREVPVRVSLLAASQDGAVSYFRGRVPDVALASARPAAAAAAPGGTSPATPSRVSFDAKPGKMELRVSVEGAAAQVLDSEMREIAVPDLTAPVTHLGTAEVLKARTMREYQALKADPDAVPVASREFSRTDRLLIRVPAYGAGDTTPAISVHLLNREGQPMMELPAVAVPAPSHALQVELPLAGLAPGEYLVEVKPADGDDASRQLVGFRVTG